MNKVVCIKKVFIEENQRSIYDSFIVGNIYDYRIYTGIIGNKTFIEYCFIMGNDKAYFYYNELNDFFITLNEWRELKINKILEND